MTKRKRKKARPKEKEALAESKGLSDEEEVIVEEYADYARLVVSKPHVEPYKGIRYLGVAGVFKIRGPVTGIQYTFTAQERVSFVATEDYEGLLQRVRPARRCCGGKTIPEQPYFGPAG